MKVFKQEFLLRGMPVVQIGRLVRIDTKDLPLWRKRYELHAKGFAAAKKVLEAGIHPWDLGGLVYFVEAVGLQKIKIGFTRSKVSKRIDSLRTGCPAELRALGWMEGTTRDEQALHVRFAHLRIMINSEWFHVTEDLLASIQSHTTLVDAP
jgi:hypothetical protein